MKATTHHHRNSDLIADVFVSKKTDHAYINRRGNDMMELAKTSDVTVPSVYHHAVSFERDDAGRLPETYSEKFAAILESTKVATNGAAIALLKALPRWRPKKFTIRGGFKTNWRAMLPQRNILMSSGSLAVMLVAAGITVWAMPQGDVTSSTPSRPVDTTTTPSPTAPANGVLSLTDSQEGTDDAEALGMTPSPETSGSWASQPSNTAAPAVISQPTHALPGDGTSQPEPTTPTPTPSVVVPTPAEEPEPPVAPEEPEPQGPPTEPVVP